MKSPDADAKKQIDDLKKQEAAIEQQIDRATAKLRRDIMLIDVPPQANDKEVMKPPDRMGGSSRRRAFRSARVCPSRRM